MNTRGLHGIIVKTSGEMQDIAPANGVDFRWNELQAVVGGDFDIVNLTHGCQGTIMVVNMDDVGEPNLAATAIAKGVGAILPHEQICGDALMCASGMVK